MKKLILTLLLAVAGFFVQAQTADELMAAKKYDRAFFAYDKLITAGANDVQTLRRAAFCLLNCTGQEAKAEQYFLKALKVDPKDVASNYYLGLIYKDAANKEKAKRYLQTAAALGSEEAKTELRSL